MILLTNPLRLFSAATQNPTPRRTKRSRRHTYLHELLLSPAMARGFVFEPPSDEEPELPYSQVEDDEEEDGGGGGSDSEDQGQEGEEAEDEDEDKRKKPSIRHVQSPWDFASYSESVAEEHARRTTTSVDFKISKALLQCSVPVPHLNTTTDNHASDSEPDKQEEYREDEDEGGTSMYADQSNSFFAPSTGASFHANSFIELNLSRPLLRACEALGYAKPTPIQAACIPLALTGRDICGSAITGSGKVQEAALRSMPDIVVATPGRVIDHLRNSMSVSLDDLAVLILDEADRLLELGFSAEIHELVRLCPKRRQTMLLSATMTEEVDELIKLSLTKPLCLSADPSAKRPATLREEYFILIPIFNCSWLLPKKGVLVHEAPTYVSSREGSDAHNLIFVFAKRLFLRLEPMTTSRSQWSNFFVTPRLAFQIKYKS